MTNPNPRIIIQEFGFVLLVHAVFIKLGVKGVEIPAVELVGYHAQGFSEMGGLSYHPALCGLIERSVREYISAESVGSEGEFLGGSTIAISYFNKLSIHYLISVAAVFHLVNELTCTVESYSGIAYAFKDKEIHIRIGICGFDSCDWIGGIN